MVSAMCRWAQGEPGLWPVIGSKGRVSGILAGKRAIGKEQAKKLAAFFRVRADLFL
jgi:antitoxin component HigA of HigAB toxin-antitoxin module